MINLWWVSINAENIFCPCTSRICSHYYIVFELFGFEMTYLLSYFITPRSYIHNMGNVAKTICHDFHARGLNAKEEV